MFRVPDAVVGASGLLGALHAAEPVGPLQRDGPRVRAGDPAAAAGLREGGREPPHVLEQSRGLRGRRQPVCSHPQPRRCQSLCPQGLPDHPPPGTSGKPGRSLGEGNPQPHRRIGTCDGSGAARFSR
uniref:Putative secreted protein n=1 Tax=Ixodes ricinus TaxID=34613 RepID=A0A6B0UQE3_IXORI